MYYRGHLLTLLVKNYANTPYMKKIFIAIIFAALFSSVSRSQTKTHFEYPTAPDSLATLQEKTSYIVLRFWDKADMKKLLNDTLAFNEAFADYVSFIPYASADSVKKSIVNLTSRYKNDAKSTLKIVKAAEKNLFSAEAPFWADEQYMLFTKAALSNKKNIGKGQDSLPQSCKNAQRLAGRLNRITDDIYYAPRGSSPALRPAGRVHSIIYPQSGM